jgi:hypothetical protein
MANLTKLYLQKTNNKATPHQKFTSIKPVSTDNAAGCPGNTALQRLLAQRAGDAPFDLDDATAGRIHRARSGGQALEGAVQAQMGEALGHDFSGVRVHTDGEAHALNEQLSAKAFTTGPDIFFRGGAYSPQSSAGQELLAHELTHVVQQASGVVDGGGAGMRVNAPGDRFEQEADAVAKAVTAAPAASAAPAVQRQELPEEDELQAKPLQSQELEDEELQMQELEEEEPLQMQALPEEEAELA